LVLETFSRKIFCSRLFQALEAVDQGSDQTSKRVRSLVLDVLLLDLFGAAMQADKRAWLRSLKDFDSAAITLAEACHFLLDPALPDSELRTAVFTRIPPNMLAQALGDVGALTRPPDDVFYKELVARYRSVRRFLPTVLKHIRFGANSCGEPVVKALDYLRLREMKQLGQDAPLAVVSKPWQRHVLLEDGSVDPRAYTFCALDELRTALRLRAEGYSVRDEDVARLSPLIHEHINMLGRYSFVVPEPVVRGELRPLRTPADDEP